MLEQVERGVHHGRKAHGLGRELGRPGEFQEIAHDGVDMSDLLGDDLEILLLGGVELEAALQGKKPHLDRGQGVADGMGHARGQPAGHGQLLGLHEVAPALLQVHLRLVHVLFQVAELLADGLDLVGKPGQRLLAPLAPGQAADGVEDLPDQDVGQEKAQGGVNQHADHGHGHDHVRALDVDFARLAHARPEKLLEAVAQLADAVEILAHGPVLALGRLHPPLLVEADDVVLGRGVFLVGGVDAVEQGHGLGRVHLLAHALEPQRKGAAALVELDEPRRVLAQIVVGGVALLVEQGVFQLVGGGQGGEVLVRRGRVEVAGHGRVPDHDHGPGHVDAQKPPEQQIDPGAQTQPRQGGGANKFLHGGHRRRVLAPVAGPFPAGSRTQQPLTGARRPWQRLRRRFRRRGAAGPGGAGALQGKTPRPGRCRT